MARKPGTTPRFAKSQIELGAYLTPPRDRKIIQRALKMEGNPGRAKDGRYDVGEWQAFIYANVKSLLDGESGKGSDKSQLELEKLRLTIQKQEFELKVLQRDYTANTEVEAWVGEMIARAKQILTRIPSKLAPLVVGRSEVDAERVMREEVTSALAQLATKPRG